MSPFARAFDKAAHDIAWRHRNDSDYLRGLEAQREKTVDDGDFDDDCDTHARKETLTARDCI